MSSSGLLGREREVAVLESFIQAGRERGSALLAVARAAAREAGYTVLGAVGVESEAHLPSRVRSLLWILSAIPVLAEFGRSVADESEVRRLLNDDSRCLFLVAAQFAYGAVRATRTQP